MTGQIIVGYPIGYTCTQMYILYERGLAETIIDEDCLKGLKVYMFFLGSYKCLAENEIFFKVIPRKHKFCPIFLKIGKSQ